MNKIHFALIGLGAMGSRWASVIAEHASLDAVIGTSIEGSATLDDVWKDDNIEALLIAVPHKYLSPITRAAFRAGKHVFCEKPGAISSGQLKRNARRAEKNKLVYKIGYNYRYHDGFIKARKLFQEGAIGDLIFIRARHGFGGREGYSKEWRINQEIGGGGHLHDQGVHLIDMAKSFMGEIKKVKGIRADNFWKAGTEDNGFVLLQDENGATASIHSSLTQWRPMHNFEIYGTKGYLSIEGLGQRYGGDDEGNERLIFCKRREDFGRNIKSMELIECDPVADHSLAHELKEFISAIEKGTPISPTAMEASKTLQIVEEVYRTNKL